MSKPVYLPIVMIAILLSVDSARSDEFQLSRFKSIQLTDVYYSEGANLADVDQDGNVDAVYGPYWFAGPDFKTKHEIYSPKPQNRDRYADHFFVWPYDFNDDGYPDLLTAGFPGTPAYVYENPADSGSEDHWTKHEVFDWVSNEAPQFVQLVGDDTPELVCTRDGRFGYATISNDPFATWQFHAISDDVAPKRFGHGLGIGDIDGDSRLDVITKDGWFAQPASLESDAPWSWHPYQFARAGGAEMYAYDVDGDGDNDVITSLAAHDFGLAWYERLDGPGEPDFRRHLIVGDKTQDSPYGILFSEPHSVALVDVDGDGLRDVVTGKTYWSHHRQSPMWDAGAVVYWFRLVRHEDRVDWVPYLADGDAGIGRQISSGDINGDGQLDFVLGGMVGGHVLIQHRETVDEQTWRKAQPVRLDATR